MSDSRARRWATTSARVIVGTGVAVAAVAAVTAGIAAPWPTLRSEPVALSATPAPAVSTVVCDGPLLALGRTVEEAGTLSIAAPQTVVSGPAASGAASRTLSGPVGAQPDVLSAAPVDGTRTEVVASGSASLADADLAGFAASSCTPPLMESWLVGGATTTGSNDLIVLANPGEVAATVQITVFGVDGPQNPPGGTDRVVAAGTQIALPLAGLLLDEESPVVRVTSTGAPVRASLQTSITRALTPGGVDQVGVIAATDTRQVIPGVTVETAPDGANSATIVRVLAPGSDGEATVTLSAVDGTGEEPAATVPLAAGRPTALAYDDLAPGRYTVTVEASVPVVAGTFEATGFDAGSDFAWYAAAPEIATPSVVAVPSGPEPTLVVANAGDTDATVDLIDTTTGASSVISVPARSSVDTSVTAGSVYRVLPSAPVHAAVGFSAPDSLAAFSVWASDAAAPPITVYP